MAVIWPTYINNVKTEMLNMGGDGGSESVSQDWDSTEGEEQNEQAIEMARQVGAMLADEYDKAIKMAMSPFGELKDFGSADMNTFTSEYERGFELLVEEGKIEKDKIECDKDENGNDIPGTGKDCDPEFNDPDTEMPTAPPVDPEELREFVKEYKDEYDLHEFTFFEFHVEEREKETIVTETQDGDNTIITSEVVYGEVLQEGINNDTSSSELSDIVATRILVHFDNLSNSHKKKLVGWVDTFQEEPGDMGYSQQTSYFNKVEQAITGAGHTSRDANGKLQFIIDVRDKVIDALETSYGTNGTLSVLIDTNSEPLPITYPYESKGDIPVRELHIHIAQQPHDSDNPEIPEILDKYFITYFSYKGTSSDAWNFTNSKIETDYLHPTSENISELKKEWFKCPSNLGGATQEDIASSTGGTLYMFTRQKLLDALEEQAEDEEPSDDPYEVIAQATIDYWKSAGIQPLKSMPAAPPAIVSSPLGGKYIGVYYGDMKTLAEDIRKALNSGKAFKEPSQKTLAATTIATNLSVGYAKHLLMLKFIYLGGIPTPVGPVPMVGFVPFVT